MRQRYVLWTLTAAAAISAGMPMLAEASSTYSMRKKVVLAAGIMAAASDDSVTVTRAQFAKMLVMASTYRSSVSESNNVAVFADVPAENEYAAYIRTAAEQGWMTGYLGGRFKPDEAVTMQEASRAVLALLGYQDSDFAGNTAANRLAKVSYLELDEEIGKGSLDPLSRADCIHLFYNLLRTNKAEHEGKTETSSTVYASVLDFTLTSDGEINPLEALENKLKGPYALKDRSLGSVLPFSLSKASFYLDGERASKDEIEEDAVVVYYNTTTKNVYGYSEGSEAGRGAAVGELEAIYYKSSDVMIPTSIVVSGVEYALETSDMQFAFSVYGRLEIGDEIVVIWENRTRSVNEDDEIEYTLVDYID